MSGSSSTFTSSLRYFLREIAGGFRQMRGRADVRRPVAEVACEVAAVRDRGADLDAAPRFAQLGAARQPDAEAAQLATRLFVTLELVKAVELCSRHLDGQASGLFDADFARRRRAGGVGEVADRFLRAGAAQCRDGRGQRGREPLGAEVGVLAAADEQPACRRSALRAMNQSRATEPACRVAGAHELLDQTSRRRIDFFGRAAQLPIVEHR